MTETNLQEIAARGGRTVGEIIEKCTLDENGRLQPCTYLCLSSDPAISGRGFELRSMMNLFTNERWLEPVLMSGVFYCSKSEAKKNGWPRGIVLNFCPHCGEKLHESKADD